MQAVALLPTPGSMLSISPLPGSSSPLPGSSSIVEEFVSVVATW